MWRDLSIVLEYALVQFCSLGGEGWRGSVGVELGLFYLIFLVLESCVGSL